MSEEKTYNDTDGVTPNDDSSHDGSTAVGHQVKGTVEWISGVSITRQPTKDTEECSENVDTEDGAHELPGWPGLSTSGDEDEPILSEGDFQEEDFLHVAEVLDETTVGEVERTTNDPGTESEQSTEGDGDDPDFGQLPFNRTSFVMGVVVGDGDGSQIGEKGEEDNQLDVDGLVDDDHGCDQVDLQMEAEGDTVLNVRLHTLEDLTGDLDSRDDGGETRGEEDDIGGSLGRLGGTLHSNTTVGLLERGSIVDTVTSHGSQMATLLDHLDDLVLMLGEDFCETIGALNKIVLGSTAETTVDQTIRVVNFGTESQHLAGFLGNGNGVPSQHLDLETEELSFSDGLGGIFTGRVEHGQHSEQLPRLIVLLDSNTEGTETTTSELGSLGLEQVGGLLRALSEVENSFRGPFSCNVVLTIAYALASDTLGDGVEGSVFGGLPALLEDLAGLGETFEGQDSDFVDGVQRFDVVGRGKSRDSHHPVDIDILSNVGLTDRQLIGSESTGLVGAKNVDTLESRCQPKSGRKLEMIKLTASDSMAVSFCTMALSFARYAAPTARVVVVTTGRPTGTPTTSKIRT